MTDTQELQYLQRCHASQRGKRPGQPDQDTAPNPLISFISQNVLGKRSFSLFHSLLNNYTRYLPAQPRGSLTHVLPPPLSMHACRTLAQQLQDLAARLPRVQPPKNALGSRWGAMDVTQLGHAGLGGL